MTTQEILRAAAAVRPRLALLTEAEKNAALAAMADALVESTDEILAANAIDKENAKGKISDVMIDRLALDEKRIRGMADGIRALISLPDPVGKVLDEYKTPGGLTIRKTSVPFGVVAIIYESRPT